MKYRLEISPTALERLWAAAGWYAERSGSWELAETWHSGFVRKLATLTENPDGCSLAAESEDFPFEVREVYYGSGRSKTHRALFRISGDVVEILTIRHFAERNVTPEDL